MSPLRGALVCSALAEANKKRAEFGMPKSQDASFYDSEEFVLGPQSDLFSWSEFSGCTKEVSCYKYTRTKQSRGGGKAVFLCSNFTSCEYAKDSVCVPATAEDAEGRPYVSCCPNCRTDEYSMRPRKRVNYREG